VDARAPRIPTARSRAALLLGVGVAYFAAGKLGLSFAEVNTSASAVWPPTGIALAAFLLLGSGVWPAIAVAAFLVNMTTSGAFLVSAGIAAGNVLEGLVGAYLVQRHARGAACFERARDVFKFALLAALLATAVSATVGTVSLLLGGLATREAFAAIWMTWWLGDTAGALLVAPAIILWVRQPHLEMPEGRLTETVVAFVSVLVAGVLCFAVPALSRYPLAFLCLPPIAWLAFRSGPREVATAIVALAVIAVFTTENGLGSFIMPTRHESLLVLQAFLATVALMMLPIAALVREHSRAMHERERAGREERRARGEAEAAIRAKDEFLAMLSHELRNPLQAIGNAVHLLEITPSLDPGGRRSLAVIRRQSENLTRMVNDLLDMARVMAGKMVVVREALDLEEVIRHCVALLRDAGRLEGRSLEVRTQSIPVNADPTRLEQMLLNLLGNALKYTPPEGAIRVISLRDGDQAVVRIEDEGIGIPPELLPRIFEPFTQGRRKPLGRERGLGIGLALVQRLAELHGGRVDAYSDGAGLGSKFVLSLPCRKEAMRGSVPAPAIAHRADARRVLVIDADAVLQAILEREGHEVFQANDGRAGVEAALRVRPEAVVIDLAAPGTDPFEVARALRARAAEVGARLRIVGVAGFGDFEQAPRAQAAGFDACLAKPIDLAELRRALGDATAAPDEPREIAPA
jgi:signal transduction histidine kinase/ActR/RegA family two-component response regulator